MLLPHFSECGTPSSRSSRSGDHQRSRRVHQNMIGVTVVWSHGDIGMRRHRVMEDMKLQGELLVWKSMVIKGVFGFEDWDKLLNSLCSGMSAAMIIK
ncbi:hypothetical protein Tco_0520803 [Tanacetum coccineum]